MGNTLPGEGTYTVRTLDATLEMIDLEPLRRLPERLGRAPRMLDAACRTGVLLRRLLEGLPTLEAKGVDASADMLQQAQATLRAWPQVHLFQAAVGLVRRQVCRMRQASLI